MTTTADLRAMLPHLSSEHQKKAAENRRRTLIGRLRTRIAQTFGHEAIERLGMTLDIRTVQVDGKQMELAAAIIPVDNRQHLLVYRKPEDAAPYWTLDGEELCPFTARGGEAQIRGLIETLLAGGTVALPAPTVRLSEETTEGE